jgi:hypothetical protein
MSDIERITRCAHALRALRVVRWCHEWPPGHPESPMRPRFVREFEDKHGEAPASAERLLDTMQRDATASAVIIGEDL